MGMHAFIQQVFILYLLWTRDYSGVYNNAEETAMNKRDKIPGLEQNKYKMNLEHLVTPESKAAIQGHVKTSQGPT